MTNDLGVIGMAVMGRNLAMNCAEKGFKVSVYNRTKERAEEAIASAKREGLELVGFATIEEFVASLSTPRKVLVMVKAGASAEAMIESILRVLHRGDIVIDCGNEHFKESEKRFELCDGYGVHYVSMGVSGGEEGARKGPSLMIGTNEEVYINEIKPFADRIAARAEDLICSALVGPRGSGHYVKMVHNGIEYAIMEVIAETYDILRTSGYSNEEMATFFGRYPAYLTEITSKILVAQDRLGGHGYLIDMVVDKAGAKGTGKWTVQESVNLGVPCPLIAAALECRSLSNITRGRGSASRTRDRISLDTLEKTLFAGILASYAEGFNLLHHANRHYGYAPNLQLIGSCWLNGCIIRSETLKDLLTLLPSTPEADYSHTTANIQRKIDGGEWIKAATFALSHGIPVAGLSAGLNYLLTTTRTSSSPLNLIQAQRDYFGAHTFKRIDRGETFHADWASGVSTVSD